MKYSKRQLNGLISSVEIWIKKYEGKCNTYGAEGCPLCKLYKNCHSCPVELKTGDDNCHGTPYSNIYDRKGWDGCYDINSWWKTYATKTDKLKELRFLISLLPKANQKKYKQYIKPLLPKGK